MADANNAHHMLKGALKATPRETHPPSPFHGGGPMPKFDGRAYAVGGLWLAERVRPFLDARDRDVFEEHVAAVKAELLSPDSDKKRTSMLREADAAKFSRVPAKVGQWVANEAWNASHGSIYAGTPIRAAAANVAKLLLKKAPSEVAQYLAELDALCVHLEALTMLRDRHKEVPSPAVRTPFRGLVEGRPTHYLMELQDGRWACFGKVNNRWQVQVGDRDTALACLPDDIFPKAVEAISH